MKSYKVQHNEIVMVVEANSKMEAIEQVVNQVEVMEIKPEQVDGAWYKQTITRNRFGTYNVRRFSVANGKSTLRYEVWGCEEVEAPVAEEVAEFELPKYGTFRTQIWTTGPNGYWAIEEVK
jgi:hypothetical protein